MIIRSKLGVLEGISLGRVNNDNRQLNPLQRTPSPAGDWGEEKAIVYNEEYTIMIAKSRGKVTGEVDLEAVLYNA